MAETKSMVGWYGRVEYASTLVPGRTISFRGVVTREEGDLLWMAEVRSGAVTTKIVPARRGTFTHLRPPPWLSHEMVERARRQIARREAKRA